MLSEKSLSREFTDLNADSYPQKAYRKLPADFTWGSATAAYQVEGAFDEDGRTASIWDTFSKQEGKVIDGSNGDVAVDQYHRYEEDAALLNKFGAKAYRMSLSWSRILPEGKKNSPINPLAIAHYRKVFETLLAKKVVPWVTLYHWDLPQCLQDEYDGFLNTDRLVEDFNYYAEVCFKEFGDLVKNWMTFNEPHTYCKLGFGYDGPHAPGRTDDRSRHTHGDPGTEVWITGHTTLLAHATAVNTFRTKYHHQNGRISIALNSDWFEPQTNDEKDVAAATRRLDFMLGWFADPIYLSGDYPISMKAQLGDRLPRFTPEQSKLVLGSCDYFALNSYTSMYVKDSGVDVPDHNDIDGNNIATEFDVNGNLIGNKGEAFWLFDCAWGFKKLLKHIKNRYNNPEVHITENGFCVQNETSVEKAQHDYERIHYYHGYLSSVVDCIVDHQCNIKGYFAWSLLDNFEWARGYTERFGITFVNFENQERTPKDSFKFLSNFFHKSIRNPAGLKTVVTNVTKRTVTEPGKTTYITKTVTTTTVAL